MARNLILWLVIASVLFMVFQNFTAPTATTSVAYSEFVNQVEDGRVRRVEVSDTTIRVETHDNQNYSVVRPQVFDPDMMPMLLDNRVEVVGKEADQRSLWEQLLVASFPILLFIGVFIFFMRQMQGGAGGRGGPMSFAKSKARMLGEDQVKTTFADVAGVDEAKEDVQELVEFLRDPSRFQRLGGQIPRGVLMSGPPGTGKTLLV